MYSSIILIPVVSESTSQVLGIQVELHFLSFLMCFGINSFLLSLSIGINDKCLVTRCAFSWQMHTYRKHSPTLVPLIVPSYYLNPAVLTIDSSTGIRSYMWGIHMYNKYISCCLELVWVVFLLHITKISRSMHLITLDLISRELMLRNVRVISLILFCWMKKCRYQSSYRDHEALSVTMRLKSTVDIQCEPPSMVRGL